MKRCEQFRQKLEEFEWADPWRLCTPQEAVGLAGTLAKEVGPRHPLFSLRKKLQAVARSESEDEVLFLSSSDGLLVLVHLTWSGRRHWFSKIWPQTTFYDSVEDWKQRGPAS